MKSYKNTETLFKLTSIFTLAMLITAVPVSAHENTAIKATAVAPVTQAVEDVDVMIAEAEAQAKKEAEEQAKKEAEEQAKREAEKAEYTSYYTASNNTQTTSSYTYTSSDNGALTPQKGVVNYNGHRETYYSQKVLPGGGLDIPGRHVAEDGTVRDGDGYICVASSDHSKGTVVETSLGTAKVYDSGCASGTVDIYTNW